MTPARTLAIGAAALLPFVLTNCSSCKGQETAPPTPSATATVSVAPVASSAPTQVALAPEAPDAGADAADASDGDAGHPKAVGPSNLAKCCDAIAGNRSKAPPEQLPIYDSFIALCKSGVVPPQFRNLAPCK